MAQLGRYGRFRGDGGGEDGFADQGVEQAGLAAAECPDQGDADFKVLDEWRQVVEPVRGELMARKDFVYFGQLALYLRLAGHMGSHLCDLL